MPWKCPPIRGRRWCFISLWAIILIVLGLPCHHLSLILLKRLSKVSSIRRRVYVQFGAILIYVTLRDNNTDYTIYNKIIFAHEVRLICYHFLVIPNVLKLLVPSIELLSLVDFSCPVVDQIEVVEVEITCLLVGSHDEMVLSFLKEPFWLFFVKKDSAFLDFT